MITEEQVNKLDSSWDFDEGFFGKLRQGVFDDKLCDEFISLLYSIFIDDESIPKHVVRLLWYIPLFMEWQKERVLANVSLVKYNLNKTEIENQLERILGIP